ncbi:MAG: hypothetical protein IKN87_05785 [Bacilli bacterium]|nr:hypothetical protein [Bacilli bacterium]
MEDIYNYILDNIYIFCLLLILVFVLIIFIMYLVKCSNGRKTDKEFIDPTLKSKDELEKISDEEIEKRVIEEYKEETRELDEKLDKLKENYKDNTSVEEIIDSLKDAKEKVASEELKKFEDEQEENAIISYKQLVDAVKGNNQSVDTIKEEKETNDTKNLIEKYENLNMEIDEEPVVEKDEKKDYSYKPNEFISPVFGRMDSSHVKYREGLSYTDKLKEEPVKETRSYYEEEYEEQKPTRTRTNYDSFTRTTKMDSEEFLKNLKEFRRNL